MADTDFGGRKLIPGFRWQMLKSGANNKLVPDRRGRADDPIAFPLLSQSPSDHRQVMVSGLI